MTRFAFPWAFLLLLPLCFATWRALRRVRGRGVPFPGLSRMPRIVSWRQRLSALPPLLVAAGLACCVVALARPQTDLSRHTESKETLAIEMAVDVSGSMTERVPSAGLGSKTRLDAVKETFRDFVSKRPDDLIGLVSFGGYATTRCPLTVDHDALLSLLDRTNVPGTDGEPATQDEYQTAIGDGLAMACARLSSATNVKSRVTILLSDGVNNFGIITPDEALGLAVQQEIKVYTIGVGDERDAAGLDEGLLRRIASETGGTYFHVGSQDGLSRALAEIDGLEKTEVDVRVYRRFDELFAPWLTAGLLLVFAGLAAAGGGRRSLV